MVTLLQHARCQQVPVGTAAPSHRWEAAVELHNFWDPTKPGYNPDNVNNVEWTDWSSANATRISWRNWGSQVATCHIAYCFAKSYACMLPAVPDGHAGAQFCIGRLPRCRSAVDDSAGDAPRSVVRVCDLSRLRRSRVPASLIQCHGNRP